MGIIIDGKEVANKIKEQLKIEVLELNKQGITPKLAVILVGDDEASKIYVRNKSKACNEVGIEFEECILDKEINMDKLINVISNYNNRKDIHGILLQSPISDHLDINKAFEIIDYRKDVDGFNPINVGKLTIGKDSFIPCTAYGVLKLFEEYNIDIKGKNIAVIGRSNIVGKPLASLLLNNDATVTVCHSKTKDLESITKIADILISAVGKPKLITKQMVKDGAIIIDVGINRTDSGIVGDVDFESIKDKASYITPVPGGVGPMTIAMLLNNVIKAAKNINNLL